LREKPIVKNLLIIFGVFIGMSLAVSVSWGADASEYRYNWGQRYKDQRRSLVPWEQLKTEDWLDLDLWKRESKARDENPEREAQWRDRNLIESMGRVLECLGQCELLRDDGTNLIRHLSPLQEGDEIITKKNSYAWIFLLDGTLVRLSPSTSISLREINIAEKKIFLYARINYGNVYWLNRQDVKLVEDDQRETDVLFFPLDLYDANLWANPPLVKEDHLIDVLADDYKNLKQNARANNLIKKNNDWIKNKVVENFIVTPNASVHGTNFKMEFIVVAGGETYLKNRSNEQIGFFPESEVKIPLTFDFRGYDNNELFEVLTGRWYRVSSDGRNIITDEELDQKLQFGEFVTSKINSLLVAREIWLKKYGHCFYYPLNEVELAENCGRRLWQDAEVELRMKFISEYTRRVETSNLVMLSKIKQQMQDRGDAFLNGEFDENYYLEAYEAYFRQGERPETSWQEEDLNSTKRFFWKQMTSSKRNFKLK